MAVSKCKNLFMVILNNKSYATSSPGLPNIFGTMTSSKSMISSFGVFIHDYSSYFRDGNYKSILDFFDKLKGPLAIFIDVESGTKKNTANIDIDPEALASRIMIFIKLVRESSDSETKSIPILELNKQVEFGGV